MRQEQKALKLIAWAQRIFKGSKVQDALVILNRIKDAEMERFVSDALAKKGIEPIGVIHEDPTIAMSWLEGTRVYAPSIHADVESIVERLEAVADTTPIPA
jgi:CO dehydrogenase nickel-insertion accessory protein CooC1